MPVSVFSTSFISAGVLFKMNGTIQYSCFDGTGLSHNSVTPVYWDTKGTDTRDTALASAVFTLCFILVGVPSNVLILVSILWQHLYREPTYILLFNLATSNLLICILVMPFTMISGFTGTFIFGSNDSRRCSACQFSAVCLYLFGLLTIHFLSLLSLDRFLFIKCPLRYHKFVTCGRSVVACVCAWVLCAGLSVPPLLGFGDAMLNLRIAVCSINPDSENRVTRNIYYLIFLALEICLPLGLLVVTNCWILYIIQKQMRKIYSVRSKRQEAKEAFREKIKARLKGLKFQKQLRLVKVFGAIWVANIITWTPFFIRVVGSAIFGDIFSKWFHVFIFVNIVSFSVIHPVIEASLIPELRNQLAKFLKVVMCLHCELNSCSSHCQFDYDDTTSRCCKNKSSLACLDFLDASFISNTEEQTSGEVSA